MRRHVSKLGAVTWLDGAVAGLGAAAVCACFAFNTILHTSVAAPRAATVATDLAYPIGDVLLLVLAVGGTAIIPAEKNPQWLLLAAAIAVNALGDTFNLFATSGSTSHLGTIVDGSHGPRRSCSSPSRCGCAPGASTCWRRSEPRVSCSPGSARARAWPSSSPTPCIGITPVAIGLATATLVMVGVRLGLSVRQLRSLTEKRHRQAITDELTGLGNRRHLFYLSTRSSPTCRRGHETTASLLYIDLDHFKEINDSFGHAAGDEHPPAAGPRLTTRSATPMCWCASAATSSRW